MAEVQPEIRTAPKLEDRSHTLPDQTRTAQQGASHGTGETTQGQVRDCRTTTPVSGL